MRRGGKSAQTDDCPWPNKPIRSHVLGLLSGKGSPETVVTLQYSSRWSANYFGDGESGKSPASTEARRRPSARPGA